MLDEDIWEDVDQLSYEGRFNRELLRATLEHLSQGVSVVDRDFRLMAWNRRYIELLDYPPGLVTLGRPIQELIRFNARRGLMGGGDIEQKVEKRLQLMRAGHAYTHERELPNGTVIEIRGNPMPDGGFVTSYSDVTAYKRAQSELQEINETLEWRVQERTAELMRTNEELSEAKLDADRANQAKTRFLASASHDLVQPLNAARLFVAAIDNRHLDAVTARMINQVESSLTAAESLLGALLDITRLDVAAQDLKAEHFELSHMLGPLATEFAALAKARGLGFRIVPSSAVVYTDPRLLRRVLQNFLSNAVRYTQRGRIVLGCRRQGNALRIEVWDTGPGIPEDKQREIFEEFRRLDTKDGHSERGLGLGLAIADRLSHLLGHPLGLHSTLGKGSVFSITVPLGQRESIPAVPKAAPSRRSADRVGGAYVLCVDNETAVLDGMEALLKGWGCEVDIARDYDDASALFKKSQRVPDLALMDYHLDAGADGIRTMRLLEQLWGTRVPCIVITADHTQDARNAADKLGYSLLRKPVKPAGLRALMGSVLSTQDREKA